MPIFHKMEKYGELFLSSDFNRLHSTYGLNMEWNMEDVKRDLI